VANGCTRNGGSKENDTFDRDEVMRKGFIQLKFTQSVALKEALLSLAGLLGSTGQKGLEQARRPADGVEE
jgi:hypothetical protein